MFLYFGVFIIIALKGETNMFSYGKDNLKMACKTGKELGFMAFIVFLASSFITAISYLGYLIMESTTLLTLITVGITGIKISIISAALILFLTVFSFLIMEWFRIAYSS